MRAVLVVVSESEQIERRDMSERQAAAFRRARAVVGVIRASPASTTFPKMIGAGRIHSGTGTAQLLGLDFMSHDLNDTHYLDAIRSFVRAFTPRDDGISPPFVRCALVKGRIREPGA